MAGGSSFVYAIATRWAVDWVVKQSPKRWSKRTAIYIAIAVLVAALSPALYEHITARGENYYQLLQVPVESTAKEIKSAYRRASLLYHPDKLGHLDEEELEAANVKFQTIRDAYEALMHQTTKSVYDKYGPDMLERAQHQASDGILTQALVNMAVFYVSAGVITFLMTLGHGSPLARKWAYTGLLLVLVADVAIKFSDWSPARSLFPYSTPFEKVEILKICFMSYMQGCHVLASVTYVDKENLVLQKLQVLETRQRQIMMQLRSLQTVLSGAKVVATRAPGGASAASASSDVPLPTVRQRRKKGGPGTTPTKPSGTAPSAGATAAANGAAGAAAGTAAAPAQAEKPFKINGFLLLGAFYLFYTYVIG